MAGDLAAAARKLVSRDLSLVAPRVREVVEASLSECRARKLDPVVYEARRSDELCRLYYQLGVTKAPNGFRTWHFYGLSVDVISAARGWDAWDDLAWSVPVARIFKENGMDWGGDWVHFKDAPHFQWGRCKPSPSDKAIELYLTGGVRAVWLAVGAV